eukprot:CAMPEP_0184370758 /NCGR_PEP_ID=MMETSP1089-20130417/163010_1 /TAXON_ID=38269 ORGANISM="Gloeochaete wittrockiana, Strain SAG46.84" /NCGR_SAMPLE_ID=MMETSP1089 /ASSEMBLY_ACC=CAM_ASM_000445 /LENGTH=67 /DNA_ID=CAMNT_0026713413 /DNA_START=361 /DNA_END=564 /DNA_ORIENTATION=+
MSGSERRNVASGFHVEDSRWRSRERHEVGWALKNMILWGVPMAITRRSRRLAKFVAHGKGHDSARKV